MKSALKKMKQKPLWNGVDSPAYVIEEVCVNSPAVPRNYLNNFLLLGDMMFYNCVTGQITGCGDEWREDVKFMYSYAKTDSVSYALWLYSKYLEERIDNVTNPEKDSVMINDITNRPYPFCMACHQI